MHYLMLLYYKQVRTCCYNRRYIVKLISLQHRMKVCIYVPYKPSPLCNFVLEASADSSLKKLCDKELQLQNTSLNPISTIIPSSDFLSTFNTLLLQQSLGNCTHNSSTCILYMCVLVTTRSFTMLSNSHKWKSLINDNNHICFLQDAPQFHPVFEKFASAEAI